MTVESVDAGYGPIKVLRSVSLQVPKGEILCLMGRNGAGKTTLLKTIMGVLPAETGVVAVDGVPVRQAASAGIGYVPQGRRLFAGLSVSENIEVGLMARPGAKAAKEEMRQDIFELFPRLRERLDQRAETLSGGEQQMLATARALAIRPEYLLLDEPTEGLQPSMIEGIETVMQRMRDRGVGVLLVEQKIEAVERLADRVRFIENGEMRDCVTKEALSAELVQRYVGV